MINNKQVNLWRGTDPPPTIYHVWIYKDEQMLLYNGEEWITFIDDVDTLSKVLELQEDIKLIQKNVDKVSQSTINNKLIIDNPILDGKDLILGGNNGKFINNSQTISENIQLLDSILTTLIIE